MPSTTPKGLVLLMHGYTACPESFDDLAAALQSDGYAVLNLLTVGHGKTYDLCPTPSDCVNKDPVYELPTNKDGYLDWVDEINKVAYAEALAMGLEDKISVVGLSLGSALATAAMARSSSVHSPSFKYDKSVLFPPFYGVTVPNLDRAVQGCAGDRDACVQSVVDAAVAGLAGDDGNDLLKGFFTSVLDLFVTESTIHGGAASIQAALRYALVVVSNNVDSVLGVPMRALTEQAFGWGDQCEDDRTNLNRGGYCNFKIENLLAVHAVSEYALAEAMAGRATAKTASQFVPVERDGYTRNGAVLQAAIGSENAAWGDHVHMCMYRIQEGCDPDTEPGNTCGVPHSCIAPGDNLGIEPFNMYWWPGMESQTLDFLSDATKPFGTSTTWSGDISECQQIADFTAADSNLFAQPNQLIKITLNKPTSGLTDEDVMAIAKTLADATSADDWTVEPNPADFGEYEMVFFGPPDVCDSLVDLARDDNLPKKLVKDYEISTAACHTLEGEEISNSCPVNAKSYEPEAMAKYRPPPTTTKEGQSLYRGFLEKYAEECETCGYTWQSGSEIYDYDYLWQEEVGTRTFWEDEEHGWNKSPKWYQNCQYGYERDSWWRRWSAKCVIPDSSKFLGETCAKKSQCHNDFVKPFIDVTCAPTHNDLNDPQYKCVVDEESNEISPYASTCSCIGFLWCESPDCAGNQCVLSTRDMKKHCKYADEPVNWFGIGESSCSNCRASENSCESFGGKNKWTTDGGRVGIVAGAAGFGLASVIGAGLFIRARNLKKRPNQENNLEMSGNIA